MWERVSGGMPIDMDIWLMCLGVKTETMIATQKLSFKILSLEKAGQWKG